MDNKFGNKKLSEEELLKLEKEIYLVRKQIEKNKSKSAKNKHEIAKSLMRDTALFLFALTFLGIAYFNGLF